MLSQKVGHWYYHGSPLNHQELIPFIERFSNAKVLCVGDVMLDHFIYGDVDRISPEAPIPVVRVHHERSMLGGAGNVVRNLSSLGAQAVLLTVVGVDSAADLIAQELCALPNCVLHTVADKDRKTSVKTRYISGSQQLLRVDIESTHSIEDDVLTQLLVQFEKLAPACDVVILSDYAKGVLKDDRAEQFIAAARKSGKPVFVDPKGRSFKRYQGASLVKPNLQELAEATNLPVATDAEVEAAALSVMKQNEIGAVLVTRGALGMMLVRPDAAPFSLPAVAREIFDVSGAGDTVAATFAAGVAMGMSMPDAMTVANVAAGIVVAKVGTATTSQEELLSELEVGDALAADTRVVALEEAVQRVRLWRRLNLRVGLVRCSFETIDAAAIQFLRQARQECDRLIVATNGSATQPLLLASMVYVDLVIAGSHTNEALVSQLKPDYSVV
jgi:D-beta-D-heptose 7-phosphate kinase/D-beta-D-heptose 1-phosphate adenosyltransferase